MRLIITVIISGIVFFAMHNFFPTEEDFEIYNSTVRLHVIANSDSEADQELKLKVRDAVLERVSEFESANKNEAIESIEAHKEELARIAQDVIKNNGQDYTVKIEVGNELYPTRYYEDFALPAGEYTSVRIIIGKGEGKNWWCVLYPPLCTNSALKYDEEAALQVGLSKDQYNLITANKSGKYKVRFRFLEMASEVFGFKYD